MEAQVKGVRLGLLQFSNGTILASRMPSGGRAPTLDKAKAQFQASF
jgi:hypothetical protein